MMAAQRRLGCRVWAWSVLLVSPERIGPADNCRGRQRSEISAVKGVPGLPVHQEDFAGGDQAAALPDGQRTPEMIAAERGANRDSHRRMIASSVRQTV